ncbi:MAG: hypothetical protein LBE81_08145 [Azonexus sp.]|jgi:hypothetical protein|uniref:hypothetical protein n=1 Tax=Azonexus sp. TaxID=1872668 RepID=UPI002835F817|nr:hypothetical protein [Azonexus sp.]MDR0776593.1 hypothetical protein [Azonexus sp.]
MRRFAIGVALSCLSALAVAADPAEIAKKMVGYEYTATRDPLPGLDGCVNEGVNEGMISDEFGYAIIRCGKDYFLTLGRGKVSSLPHYHILDAIVLPKHDYYATSRDNKSKQLVLGRMMCEFDGDSETEMLVLLRWGKQERVTSKNGVLAAWGYDLEKGKIISLDISHIVCEKPDEP